MTEIDWDKLIADEDRLIENHDRRFRRHAKSLDSMGEELIFKVSMARYEQTGHDNQDGDFISSLKSERLKAAIRKLTPKQLEVVVLHFGYGYTQEQIAEIIGCAQSSVSERLANAIKRLVKSMNKQ